MNKDETLLDLAKRNMEIANILYAHKETDEGFLNHVGYHLQQCVELTIKHFLETHGIVYAFTHDIDELLDQVPQEYRELFTPISDLYSRTVKFTSRHNSLAVYAESVRAFPSGNSNAL